MFIATLFTMAKIWQQPKCPSIDKWIKKKWCLYIVEYDSVIKKNDILPSATTWMNLEGIVQHKIYKPEKDKGQMLSLICRI